MFFYVRCIHLSKYNLRHAVSQFDIISRFGEINQVAEVGYTICRFGEINTFLNHFITIWQL